MAVSEKCCDSRASVLGMPSAPMPKKTPSKLSLAPRSPSLTSAARALVAPLSTPPPKPIRKTKNWIRPLLLAKAMPSKPGHHQQRADDEHPLVAEPVHHRAEDQRAGQDAEGQQRGERADAVVVEVEPLGQHVVHRAQRQEDDAEQQHPQAGGGEDQVAVDT